MICGQTEGLKRNNCWGVGGNGGCVVDENVSTAQWTEMFSRAFIQGLLYTPVILLFPKGDIQVSWAVFLLLLFQKL